METVINKNSDGYGYKYTDIAEIHRYLEKNNMKYYQEIETNEANGQDYIMTYRFIDGKWEEKPKRGCKVVDATLQGIKNPAQEQGSALTYARRYSLLMAFGLATDDDDAQSLSKPKEEITTKEQAEQYKLTFGKHTGKTIKELVEKEKDYCNWLYKNEKTDPIIKNCLNLMLEDKKEEDIFNK
jgi:uncharacterized protein (DUF3820 family)